MQRIFKPKLRRGILAKPLLAVSVLVAAFVASAQTVPEYLLFRERLMLNLLELDSDVELRPLDLTTQDGLVLRSWYHPPAGGKPVIVYFPGRAGDVINKPHHLFELAERGYGLTLAGYRGYGGNPGRPSERKLYADAASLLVQLAEDGLAPHGIVLYGYSMGTGIASFLAAQSSALGVILEAPFTSFAALVHETVRPVPLWMVRTRFDTGARIGDIHAPILLLAGEEDRVTPPAFAELLAGLSDGMSSLHVLPGATHDTLIEAGAWDLISSFLETLEGALDMTPSPALASP